MRHRTYAFASSLALAAALLAPACSDATPDLHGPAYDVPGSTNGGDGGAPGSGPGAVDSKPPPPAGVFDWRDAMIYFAFVDRFFDADKSNNCTTPGVEDPGQYKGGDWKGVTQKIQEGYFTNLGVNVLWLSVPMQNATVAGKGNGQGSPPDNHMYSGYHGYWPSEPDKAESCFGTKQELIDLVNAAHQKGIKILFDYAMVHVHDSSSVYKDHPEWFWPKTKDGQPCLCSDSGACTWANDGDKCWFADYLPHFNYTVAAGRDWSVKNAVQWIKDTGIDGYRLDAIKHVDISWLTQLRTTVNSEILATQSPRQTFYMVGETFDFQDRPFLKSFVDPTTKLDGQFDFPLRIRIAEAVLLRSTDKLLTVDDKNWSRTAPVGMAGLADFLDKNDAYYGPDAVMSTFVGNHDLPRSIHLAEDNPPFKASDDGKNGCTGVCAWSNPLAAQPTAMEPYERFANAFGVLLTTKGAPLVYYGDEIGLAGAGDPDNRRVMTFDPAIAGQKYLRERISTLTGIRKAHPALRRGARTTLLADADLWLFEARVSNAADPATGDTVYVAINRSDTDRPIDKLPAGSYQELVSGSTATGPNVTIPKRQTRIFTLAK